MSEPNVRHMLLANAALVAMVGQRITAQQITQQESNGPDAYPAVVFQRVGSSEQETLCGTDDFVAGTWQIDAYDPDRDQAVAVAGAIRSAMVHYSGDADGANVNRVRRDSSFDIGPEIEPGLYRRTQTFTIWYVET